MQSVDRAAVHDNHFRRQALLGVFFHRDQAQAVAVTGLWVDGKTLEIALELVPWPVYICIPPPGAPDCPVFTIPPQTGGRHAYALVAVSQAALARVNRLVVIQEQTTLPRS